MVVQQSREKRDWLNLISSLTWKEVISYIIVDFYSLFQSPFVEDWSFSTSCMEQRTSSLKKLQKYPMKRKTSKTKLPPTWSNYRKSYQPRVLRLRLSSTTSLERKSTVLLRRRLASVFLRIYLRRATTNPRSILIARGDRMGPQVWIHFLLNFWAWLIKKEVVLRNSFTIFR